MPPLGHFSLIRFAKDGDAARARDGVAEEIHPAARAAS